MRHDVTVPETGRRKRNREATRWSLRMTCPRWHQRPRIFRVYEVRGGRGVIGQFRVVERSAMYAHPIRCTRSADEARETRSSEANCERLGWLGVLSVSCARVLSTATAVTAARRCCIRCQLGLVPPFPAPLPICKPPTLRPQSCRPRLLRLNPTGFPALFTSPASSRRRFPMR